MKIKFITANTALGVPKMNNLLRNILIHIKFHDWRVLLFWIFKDRAASLANISSKFNKKRAPYFKKHSTLENALVMLEEEQPDVFTIQETLYQIHKNLLEKWLLDNGYKYYSWGLAAHHSDATVATVIASKIPAFKIELNNFPQLNQMGGGAGITGLKFEKYNLIILGMHLAHGAPQTKNDEINYLINFCKSKKNNGLEIVLAGDFNDAEENLKKLIDNCNFISLDHLTTCPSCFPKMFRKKLDHIFVSPNINTSNTELINFKSDHLGIKTELDI